MGRAQLILALLAIPLISSGQSIPQDGADQDQPGQAVARLGVIEGEVSVRRGDSGEWLAAVINAPLLPGDSVSVGPGGRAEMQLDYANFVRIAGDSELRISALEGGRNQIQLARGLITFRTLRDSSTQTEISTPDAAVRPLRLAAVRVEVGEDGATRISVRRGEAEASTPRGTERIREGNMMLVRGNPDDPEYQVVYAPPRDGWDSFNDQRDGYLERAQSNRYVSPDITGAEDLDAYGRWDYDPAYGNVWTPTVPASWAPYRNGQWVWEDFYGWTWVDADPWGWAPFHYGSWYQRAGFGWTWFPGVRTGHYWWHPALVGFVGFGGGSGIGFGFGNVGWIPLAPYERFHPWYGPHGWGRDRFGFANNVNIIRNTNIVNVYRNAGVGGATAVSSSDFQRGQFRNRMVVNRDQLQQASLVHGAVPLTPTANNLRFTDRNPSVAAPRSPIGNQRFFSRSSVNGSVSAGNQRMPFAQQQASVRSTVEGSRFGAGRPEPSAGSGWQRFGEPNQTGNRFAGDAPVEPRFNQVQRPGQQSTERGGDWGRFGNPQGAVRQVQPEQRYNAPAPARQAQPQQSQRDQFPTQRQGYSQGRYEAPYQQQRPAAPGNDGGRNYSGGRERSLQVAPPIVRQRESSPAYNGGSNRGYDRGSAPSPSYRSAPGPSYRSAPAPKSGNGGGARESGNRGGSQRR